MKGDTEHLAALVQKVQRWLVCKRWRKAIYGAVSVQKCEWQPLDVCVGGGSGCGLCVDVVEGVVSLCGEGTVC